MANAFRGEASFAACGRSYTLTLTIDAICEAEDALGMGADAIVAQYGAGVNARIVRALVWAGMQAKHPCSIEEAGGIVEAAGFGCAMAAIEKALVHAMPEAAPEENPPKRDRAGTGWGSWSFGLRPGSIPQVSGGRRPGHCRRFWQVMARASNGSIALA